MIFQAAKSKQTDFSASKEVSHGHVSGFDVVRLSHMVI